VQLNEGGLFSFKSLVLPNARIGEDATFIVKENINGKIQLEMTKNGNEDASSTGNKHRYFDMRV
jgi:hypothetical protein